MRTVYEKRGGLRSLPAVAFVTACCLASSAPAEENEYAGRWSVSVEVGNWQPHSLNDEPRFDTFGAAGATPYYGVAATLPFIFGMELRFSLGYWSLRDLDEIETVHSLTLHPVSLEVKYRLVPNYRLSAYVIYGAGICWGVENETQPFEKDYREARAGWGATLGAGFDVSVTRRFGIGMTFQYHFVRFPEELGGVDDFSGPKITFSALYYPR